jgi:tetratricopeptide (TPR) repeat protein
VASITQTLNCVTLEKKQGPELAFAEKVLGASVLPFLMSIIVKDSENPIPKDLNRWTIGQIDLKTLDKSKRVETGKSYKKVLEYCPERILQEYTGNLDEVKILRNTLKENVYTNKTYKCIKHGASSLFSSGNPRFLLHTITKIEAEKKVFLNSLCLSVACCFISLYSKISETSESLQERAERIGRSIEEVQALDILFQSEALESSDSLSTSSSGSDEEGAGSAEVSPQNSPPKASPIVGPRVFERCSSWFASDRSDLNELREVIKELEEAKGSVNAAKELDRCKVALDFYSILPKVTQEGFTDQDRHTFADAVFQSEQKGYGFESILRREHYSEVAYSMLIRKRHSERLQYYKRMIELEPNHENNAAIFSRIGACYMHLKQFDVAVENLLKSIALGGNDIHSRLNLATCHVFRGDFPNAIFVLEAALRKFSDDNAKLDQVQRRLTDTILNAFKKTKKTCYAEKAITLLTSTFGNDTKKFPDWAREIYSELELFKITPKGNQALQTDWAFLN